jgi:hypothetical protein
MRTNGQSIAPAGETAGQADTHNHDNHIDPQYIKDADAEDCYANIDHDAMNKYAMEPWAHCKDAVGSFMSLRYYQREEFRSKLEPGDRQRVDHESTRLSEARRNFESNPKNEVLLKELHNCGEKWKAAVAMKTAIDKEPGKSREKQDEWSNHQPRSPKIGGTGWPNPLRTPVSRDQNTNGQQAANVPAANLVRGRVDEQAESNSESFEPDPYYGFKAYAIYFKKSKNGSYTRHDHPSDKFSEGPGSKKAKWPNQKILIRDLLQSTEGSPLMEPCEKDHIRYFHFPANNMGWIEVRLAPLFNSKDK